MMAKRSSKLLRATRPGEHPTIGAYIVGGNVKRLSNIGNRRRLVLRDSSWPHREARRSVVPVPVEFDTDDLRT